MNKIEVESKKQEVKCEEVNHFADSSFHNIGFKQFLIGYGMIRDRKYIVTDTIASSG